MKTIKTIKIIDLLNKIANGEEIPKKIIKHYLTDDLEWEFQDNCQVEYGYSMRCFCDKVSLNDEVEIIEEDKENKIEKIEKIFSLYLIDSKIDCESKDGLNDIINELIKKVDEIIDYLENKEKENENE